MDFHMRIVEFDTGITVIIEEALRERKFSDWLAFFYKGFTLNLSFFLFLPLLGGRVERLCSGFLHSFSAEYM